MRKSAYITAEKYDTAAFSNEGLTFEEEIELSKKILAGEAAKRALAGKGAPGEKERTALDEAVRDGERAYERLVLANLPRAVKIAVSTWKKNRFGLNDVEDYRQTALKVICTCARTYDWRTGCRFGTYVHNCLRNEMLRENARTGYALRIPEEELCRLNGLRRLKDEGKMGTLTGKAGKSAEKLLSSAGFCKSLEEPVSREEGDTEFGEMIADPAALTAEMIEDDIAARSRTAKLMDALAALPEDEQDLLRGRMGFDGEPRPLKAYVGVYARSISGVQKKQLAAEKHLREIYEGLPEGGPYWLNTLSFIHQAGERRPLPVKIFSPADKCCKHGTIFHDGASELSLNQVPV